MRRDYIIGASLAVTVAIASYLFTKKTPQTIKVQIDPSVYMRTNMKPAFEHPQKLAEAPLMNRELSTYLAPYDTPGFGIDMARNRDTIDPETYLSMPLESDGIVYNTKDMYSGVEEESEGKIPKKFKYIRFKILAVRDSSVTTVEIGGIRFLLELKPIQTTMEAWNPHTGEKKLYTNGEWSDSDQWCIVFIFSEAVETNRYEITSSLKSPDMDPLHWTVEGSNNATYWVLLDERMKGVSLMRNTMTQYYMMKL